jgi:TRAP-type C4-dicarboxylate transport system substrate-binding protein
MIKIERTTKGENIMRLLKTGSLIICILLIGFTSVAFGQVKLNYSIFFPAPHKNSDLATEWGKEIEKRTGGKVQVTMFYGGTLTPPDKCYDGVVKGISDIGFSVFSYTMGKFPLTEVIDLPLGYKSAVGATKLINEYYNKFKPKEFDDVKVMYLHAHGPGILHTKSAVNKLEDLKGKKIRSTGTVAKIVTALGGSPVAMPMSDTYDSLSRGVVDGTMAPVETLEGWKVGEVIKFTTEDFGAAYSVAFFVVMNKAKWNSLPPDIQKIIETVNAEWIVKQGQLWDSIDKSGRDFSLKLGNKFIPLSKEEDAKWAKAVTPMFNEYVKEKKATGLPADEVLKFCVDRLKQL